MELFEHFTRTLLWVTLLYRFCLNCLFLSCNFKKDIVCRGVVINIRMKTERSWPVYSNPASYSLSPGFKSRLETNYPGWNISRFNPACEMPEYYFKLGHAVFHPYLFQYCSYQLSFCFQATARCVSIVVQASLYKRINVRTKYNITVPRPISEWNEH
jgi:hypothetical protein